MTLNLKRLSNVCLTVQQNTKLALIEELRYLDAVKAEITACCDQNRRRTPKYDSSRWLDCYNGRFNNQR